ncbi:hypothetical protein [Nannocystis pusilla]|uniref:hypothetical protein n=1 Tax=Nannocystis pusilla TaxID=889268 RepID=UPI003B7FFF5A
MPLTEGSLSLGSSPVVLTPLVPLTEGSLALGSSPVRLAPEVPGVTSSVLDWPSVSSPVAAVESLSVSRVSPMFLESGVQPKTRVERAR